MSPATPRMLVVWVAAVLLTCSPLAGQTARNQLLGQWHGTSTCVKASWNASCNDEEVFLQFVPGPSGLPGIMEHAFKRVGTEIESMGDLEILPDTVPLSWIGDFSNSRVHIRWVYQVSDSGLTGTLFLLPSMRVGRNARARRDSTWRPPSGP